MNAVLNAQPTPAAETLSTAHESQISNLATPPTDHESRISNHDALRPDHDPLRPDHESPITNLTAPAPNHESRISDHAPFRRSRRNGKIARLPKKLRLLINELLSEGLPYADIITRLQESTDPPLPSDITITEKNLSNWHTGGFQDWEKHQERMELISGKLDFAIDLAQSSEPHKLQELSLQLAAVRVCEFLSELAIADPQTDPLIYLRLLSALPRIAKESLNLQKYRDSIARGTAGTASASEEDRQEAARTAFLDGMDDLLGLKSYRNRSAALPGSADLQSAVSHGEADLRLCNLPTPATHEPPPMAHQPHPENLPLSNPPTHKSINPAAVPPLPLPTTEPPAVPDHESRISDHEPTPPTDTPGQPSTDTPEASATNNQNSGIDDASTQCSSVSMRGSTPSAAPLAEFCPQCNEICPPLLPSGERPDFWCSSCGTSLPRPKK